MTEAWASEEEFVALIPARGGSKGIPRKNLALVRGRSLVQRSIDAAREAAIARVIVSTDDDEIAQHALRCGAEVVRRPPQLASDAAPTIDAVVHALGASGIREGAVVLLQPTSPLRTARSIRGAMRRYVGSGHRALASVSIVNEHPVFMRRLGSDGVLTPIIGGGSSIRRQDLPAVYRVNGAIYIQPIAALSSYTSFNDAEVGYDIPSAEALDVDTMVDLEEARRLATD